MASRKGHFPYVRVPEIKGTQFKHLNQENITFIANRNAGKLTAEHLVDMIDLELKEHGTSYENLMADSNIQAELLKYQVANFDKMLNF